MISRQAFREAVATLPCFQGLKLEAQDLEGVRKKAQRVGYPPGAVLFVEGEPCDRFFILRSGRVRLFKTSSDGREQLLRVMRGGDFFCVVPMLEGGGYPVTAQALERTEAVVFPSQAFAEHVLGELPPLARKMIHALCRRIMDLSALVEALSFQDVRRRVARTLLNHAERHGVPQPSGYVVLTQRITHQQLASSAGTVREVVTRVLARFREQKVILVANRRIQAVDPKGLHRVLESGSSHCDIGH